MTTPPLLPRWQGQGWPVKRLPTTSTRVAKHVSGREVRTPLFVAPLYQWEINFEALSSDTRHRGLAENSLLELQSFYLSLGGALLPFLYIDPVQNQALGQVLGTGDGATTTFAFERTLGSGRFTEPVGWVTSVTAIYLNGQPVGQGASDVFAMADVFAVSDTFAGSIATWTLSQPSSLVFASAPSAGAVITADFNYAFLCRFSDDQVEFDQFMDGIHSMDSLKFQTFR